LKRSYPAVFSAARPDAARQVVLLVVDRSTGGSLRLIDAAAMLTNPDYVPCESSFELSMSAALVWRRSGVRQAAALRPGRRPVSRFRSTDVEPNVAVEVWGVKGRESYDLRRKVKLGLYETQRATLPLLEWDVTEPLPDVQLRG
jgi:hypothetical protein